MRRKGVKIKFFIFLNVFFWALPIKNNERKRVLKIMNSAHHP